MDFVLTSVAPSYPPPHHPSRRTSGASPLPTTFLLVIIFTLVGFFSCYYHRLRSSFSHLHSHLKPNPISTEENKMEDGSLPVVMPGDRIAKFIALPCRCQPRLEQKITVEEVLQKPPKSPLAVVPMYIH